MIDDPRLMELFYPFNRSVGLYRSPIQTYEQFREYIDRNNGIRDCFASVYSSDGYIDKIFFDIDSKTHFSSVRDSAVMLYQHLTSKGYRCIPVFSGRKGFHIHLLLKREQYDSQAKAKSLLKSASISIIADAFGIEVSKLLNGELSRYVDPTTIGDVSRIMRIPNTLRPPQNDLWCVPLPESFPSMSESELTKYAKEPHILDYTNQERPRLKDLASSVIDKIDIKEQHKAFVNPGVACDALVVDDVVKHVVRPCLYNRIHDANPSHTVRLAMSADMLNLGYSQEQVVDYFSRLGWVDFNRRRTADAVKQCSGLNSYSCKTLRLNNIPKVCCLG